MEHRSTDTDGVHDRAGLRHHIGRVLDDRRQVIVNDAVAVFPFTGPQPLDPDYAGRLCDLILQVLTASIEEGELDARAGLVADLWRMAQDQSIGIPQLYSLVFLIERTALDEVALDESFGSAFESWPVIAQTVRRGSFNALAAFTEHLAHQPVGAIKDPLTTLHARAVLEAVLEKEIQRAERFAHPFALILFDVDRLAEINATHGYGFGNRVLERIGIMMKNYFREQDWVTRHSEDTFAVVLPETLPEYAELLAERVRVMVQERLALRDYRTEERVPVTVSVAVVIAKSVDTEMSVEQLMEHAEETLHRAKHAGRNRVEKLDLSSPSLSPLGAARYLGVSQKELLALVDGGELAAMESDRSLRFDRGAVEDFRRRKLQPPTPNTQ